MVSKSSVLGAAGEHYVMCQLLRRGMIAALAPAGVPLADIIVTDEIGDRLCAIQVKSRVEKGSDGGWHMQPKHENIESDALFYVFVDFGADLVTPPVCYVIPSAVVAEVLRKSFSTWLATPGKGGKPHSETNTVRRLLPNYDKPNVKFGYGPGWLDPYRENWALLERSVDRIS